MRPLHMHLSRFAAEDPGEPYYGPPRLGDEQPFITASGKGGDEDIRGAPGRLLADPAGLPTVRNRGVRFLLRKEVIQPHLPVRLPCYDFTPIIDPTLDGSLPCGLGHRLHALPTFRT